MTRPTFTLLEGDVLDQLASLPDESVHCVVTSPPYLNARPEYGCPTREQFADVFYDLRRVCVGVALVNVGRLFRSGTEVLWWIDVLHAAEHAGWSLVDTLVWIKPNANPIHGNVVADSHEYVLCLAYPGSYDFCPDQIRTEYAESSVPRMNRKWVNSRGVKNGDRDRTQDRRWVNPAGARARSFIVAPVGKDKGNAHPAPMALDLAADLVMLASREGQTVLDPFAGSGTTALAALALGRSAIGIELNPEYASLARRRVNTWDKRRMRLAQTSMDGTA